MATIPNPPYGSPVTNDETKRLTSAWSNWFNILYTQLGGASAQPILDNDFSANGLLTRTSEGSYTSREIEGTNNQITVTYGDGVSGNPTISVSSILDLGSITSLEIPNSAGPAVNAPGEIAIDLDSDGTNVTQGSIIYYDGNSTMNVVAVDTIPSTNGHAVTYNSSTKKYEFAAITVTGTITSGTWNGDTIGVAYGGTGQTTYTNGQLLIGNTTGNTLTKATLTEGEGIDISNGTGSITISAEDASSSNKGVATFDATDFTVTSGDVTVNAERIQDLAGAMVTGNTETGITVTYQDVDGTIDFVVSDLTVAGDTGSTGMTPGDTLTIAGGTEITTAMSGDTLTINSDFTPSSTDTLTNKTFDANGAGNSLSNVDVADLANGTDGELITWGSDAVATTVAAGSAGEVLTSNGAGAAPTFQAAAGGDVSAGRSWMGF